MIQFNYSVVRFIPDPARGEALNIGILLWGQDRFKLRLDDRAIKRVVTENPWLALDSLVRLEPYILESLYEGGVNFGHEIPEFLKSETRFPVVFTEPRFTIADATDDAMETELESLVARIVTPRRRTGHVVPSVVERVERHFRRWIDKDFIHRNVVINESQSGATYVTQFFANSGANLVFETLKLDLKREQNIRDRAAAEAWKIHDIAGVNQLRFVVHLQIPSDKKLTGAVKVSERMIRTAGGDPYTDLDEALSTFEEALQPVA